MAHPSLIRGSLFPFLDDSKNIPRSIQDLSRVGWIEIGEDSQRRPVGRVTNFLKHQRIDKPQSSKIKGSSVFLEQSKNDLGVILDCSKGEGKGMEGEKEHGKGSDGLAPKPRKAKVEVSDEEWMAELKANPNHQGINIDAEYSKACEWCRTKNRTPSRRFFANWLGKAVEDKPLAIVARKPMQSVTDGPRTGMVNGRWVSVC